MLLGHTKPYVSHPSQYRDIVPVEQDRFDGLVERIRSSRVPSPAVCREIRERAKVSIREGADELGVAPMTLLRWERGEVRPRRENARLYRQFLDALQEATA